MTTSFNPFQETTGQRFVRIAREAAEAVVLTAAVLGGTALGAGLVMVLITGAPA